MELIVEFDLASDSVPLFESLFPISTGLSDRSLESAFKKPKLGSGAKLENSHSDCEVPVEFGSLVLQPDDCVYFCSKPHDLFELGITVTHSLNQDVKPPLVFLAFVNQCVFTFS